MNKNAFYKLGWVIAAAVAGVFVASGFQDTTNKIGVVDITQVVEKSDFGIENQKTFNEMKAAREGLLQFMDDNRILTMEQAQELIKITLNPQASAEDKAKAERIKNEVKTAVAKNKELTVKPNPTPEDRALMQDYAKRAAAVDGEMNRWLNQFTGELQIWADGKKLESYQRARAALGEVAKAQAFTAVFETSVMPYGANDLTDATLKAMNAKK